MTRPDLDAIEESALSAQGITWGEVQSILTYCRELEAAQGSLFAAIEHGDDEHRAWLSKAVTDHFAGRPVDRPCGKGSAERIRELEAENKRLREQVRACKAETSEIIDAWNRETPLS